ncbi:MAG: DUF362 domain-containing protein [Nanoarchaeota archaeon]|nr:DUF362 domain-containing protein [Nanoarchaeota archaeon]
MKVSIVKCDSYAQKKVDQAVEESLNLIGFKFKKGMKVLLKPNLLAPFKPECNVTTHPSILIALCKLLKKENAKIFIGDSPGYPNTKRTFEICGMVDVANEYCAELSDFNSLNSIKFENKNNKVLKEVNLPEVINKVNLIINLPKLKTHVFMKYTGAVKNLYGFIIGGKKGYYHLMTRTEKKFAEMLIDLHDFVKPQLTVMDAVIGMEGNGPASGMLKQTGLILASEDCTALDIVASGIIGYKPEDILTISEAKERGFDHKIEKVGLTDVKVLYKKPFRLHQKILPQFILNWAYRPRIRINNQKCKKCLICYKQCPTKAIKMEKNILRINPKKCIRCYCCHEICPSHAIDIKYSFFIRYGRKLLELLQY